ncbi:MAG: Uma2 family endonuclease [Planctomycetota bacterium]
MHQRTAEEIMIETEFRSTRAFTQAEFEEWAMSDRVPCTLYRYELLGGHVVMEPPAGYPHGETAAALVALLYGAISAAKAGKVYGSSQGFALPSGDTVEPDIAFVSCERLATGPHPQFGKHLRIVPDLVVEILSPSTRHRDQIEKREIYGQNGVREYWIVDPIARQVTVVTFGHERATEVQLQVGDALTSSLVPGLAATVGQLFDS